MAGFLYLGAGAGMGVIALLRKFKKTGNTETKLTGKELPYIVAMILLDIAAPVCLLIGLKSTSAANASLLNNFEIVATAIVALAVFKEKISLRLWLRLWRGISRCRLGRRNRFRRFIFRAVFIVEDTFYGIPRNNAPPSRTPLDRRYRHTVRLFPLVFSPRRRQIS